MYYLIRITHLMRVQISSELLNTFKTGEREAPGCAMGPPWGGGVHRDGGEGVGKLLATFSMFFSNWPKQVRLKSFVMSTRLRKTHGAMQGTVAEKQSEIWELIEMSAGGHLKSFFIS